MEWVADLMVLGQKSLDEPVLNNLFSQQEVELIKTIPISLGNREDRLTWEGTNNGIFSVKSAYHLHREILASQEARPSKFQA